ncbi:SDR family NAD(P)-dependent oxidoreductase [Saccharomonospora sp. NPDC046836]|uniref:SDR family NAD(P)-dependent oxidoreductase n=1 Tax=Saccharomonospora sp. NPDC046836 TaxID=3156921 RepID=UPI00340C189A
MVAGHDGERLGVPRPSYRRPPAHWRTRPSGAVVNMATRTWLAGGTTSYATSKAGVVELTRALAVDLAPCRVRVSAVPPSYVLAPSIEGM